MSPSTKPKFKLSDEAAQLVLHKSVQHVFESNFNAPPETIDTVNYDALNARLETKTLCSFVKLMGDFNATLYVIMSEDLVGQFSRDALGMEIYKEESFGGNQIIQDAMGEIVNMMAGTFKNMLSRAGMHCRLSPPEGLSNDRLLLQRVRGARKQWNLNIRVFGEAVQVLLLGS